MLCRNRLPSLLRRFTSKSADMSACPPSHPKRMQAPTLAEKILAEGHGSPSTWDFAVVDVRDDDHVGGHIRGSVHAPSDRLEQALPSLVERLRGKRDVVFHCALSQQRGPSAAARYRRVLERGACGQAKEGEDGGRAGDGKEGGGEKRQQVWILDGGFTVWRELYGGDERLTEGYSKVLWMD